MRCNTGMMPQRVGLSPTVRSVSSLPGTMLAATSQNAALEMSPGMVMSLAAMSTGPVTAMSSPSSETEQGMPKCANRRSVWSRVTAGWCTRVVPRVSMPASSTALFTCALAIGSV